MSSSGALAADSATPESLPDVKGKRGRIPPSAIAALLLLFGLFGSLAVIEIGVRVAERTSAKKFADDRPRKNEQFHETSRAPRPSKVAKKLPGEFRIIALGDSFTFGPGLHSEDAYPARLERGLHMLKPEVPFTVLNYGMRGYSTVQEHELLSRSITLLNPDLVILQVTLNDPERVPYRVTHKYLDEHGRVALHGWVFRHWHTLRMVVERILNTQTHSDYLQYYYNLFDDPELWRRFREALLRIKSLTHVHGAKLAVVVFPLFSHPLDKSYPFARLHKKIAELLKSEKMPYLDLLPRFKNIKPEWLQIMPGIDSHPNEIAHRIAADSIMRFLIRHRFTPVHHKAMRTDIKVTATAHTRKHKHHRNQLR